MNPEEDEPMEICRRCGGAGCNFCAGSGEVPFGTFADEDAEPLDYEEAPDADA